MFDRRTRIAAQAARTQGQPAGRTDPDHRARTGPPSEPWSGPAWTAAERSEYPQWGARPSASGSFGVGWPAAALLRESLLSMCSEAGEDDDEIRRELSRWG